MGKFVFRKTETGYHFRLTASNGKTLGSSEVYASKQACLDGIDSVIRNASGAKLEDQTAAAVKTENNPKYEMYIDKANAYRFRLTARNGEPILASEPYKSKETCLNGIGSVRINSADAIVIETKF